MAARRGPGQRAGLHRDAVVAAARSLIADDGIDGLTMRSLARRLGVTPNAVYGHVTDKTALIDLVLDDVLDDVDVPDVADRTADAAEHAVRTLMTSTFDVLVRHLDLLPTFVTRQGSRGPNAQRLGAAMTPMLEQLGHTGDDAREAVRILIVHTIGFAAFIPNRAHAHPGPLGSEQLRHSHARSLDWLLAGLRASTHT